MVQADYGFVRKTASSGLRAQVFETKVFFQLKYLD